MVPSRTPRNRSILVLASGVARNHSPDKRSPATCPWSFGFECAPARDCVTEGQLPGIANLKCDDPLLHIPRSGADLEGTTRNPLYHVDLLHFASSSSSSRRLFGRILRANVTAETVLYRSVLLSEV